MRVFLFLKKLKTTWKRSFQVEVSLPNCYNLRMEIDPKLLKPYSPKETESRIYTLWEESGFFNPDVCVEKGNTKPDAKPFTIIMPPPNVTGILHMGHALMLTLQDIMIRYHRMKGDRTLWL